MKKYIKLSFLFFMVCLAQEVNAMSEYQFRNRVILPEDTSPLDGEGNDLDKPFESGRFMLHIAVFEQKKSIVRFLLKKGANPNLCDDNKLSPLHCAVMVQEDQESLAILDLLLHANGVEIDLQDNDGFTPLHRAVLLYKLSYTAKLIKRGADPYIESYDCQNVIARAYGSQKLMAMLAKSSDH